MLGESGIDNWSFTKYVSSPKRPNVVPTAEFRKFCIAVVLLEIFTVASSIDVVTVAPSS